MSLQVLLAAFSIAAVAAAVQGAVGFGGNLVAVPTLLLVSPDFVPGPTQATSIVLTLLLTRREQTGADWSEVGWAVLGRLPGIGFGIAALLVLPSDGLGIVLGTVILAAVAASVANVVVPRNRATLVGAGVVSGFSGTAVSVGGPPIALLYQRASGPAIRANMSRFLLVGSVTSALAIAAAGRFGQTQVAATAALVPGTVSGYLISGPARRFLDAGFTRHAVLGLSGVSGLAVLVRSTIW